MHLDAFSDINRQQFFGEDPSHYVDEVKQSLAGERGLSPRNRDLVMEVLGRLADRVQSAENSRNAVVNELVSLRERFQVREIEYCGLKTYYLEDPASFSLTVHTTLEAKFRL